MRLAATELPYNRSPRCAACGDVIGVYEGLVHVIDGVSRSTSRAAERGVTSSDGNCYHLGCFERLPDRA
jgi:hypothetical protein